MPSNCYNFNGIGIPSESWARCCVPAGATVDLQLKCPLVYYARVSRGRSFPDEDCLDIFCGRKTFKSPEVIHFEIPPKCFEPERLVLSNNLKSFMTEDRDRYSIEHVPYLPYDSKQPGSYDERSDALVAMVNGGYPNPNPNPPFDGRDDHRDDRDDRRRSRREDRNDDDRRRSRREDREHGSSRQEQPDDRRRSRRHSRAPKEAAVNEDVEEEDRHRSRRPQRYHDDDLEELATGTARMSVNPDEEEGRGERDSSHRSRSKARYRSPPPPRPSRSTRKEGPPVSSSKWFNEQQDRPERKEKTAPSSSSSRRESRQESRHRSSSRAQEPGGGGRSESRPRPNRNSPRIYWAPDDVAEWWPVQEEYDSRDFRHMRRVRQGVPKPDWHRFDREYKRAVFSRKYFERDLLRNYYDGLEPVIDNGAVVAFHTP